MKKIVFLLMWVPGGFAALAQNGPTTAALAAVAAQLKLVKTANAQFVQKVDVAEPAHRATFAVKRTANKGKLIA